MQIFCSECFIFHKTIISLHRFSASTHLRGCCNEWKKLRKIIGSLRNEKKLHKNFVVSFFFAYFAPRLVVNAFLAQLVEHVICNLKVVGSNPTEGSKFLYQSIGKIPEWPNGADCKSAGFYLRWFESISSHTEVERFSIPGTMRK